MRSYREIIDVFGGVSKLAMAIDESPRRVSHWYMRDSIPAGYYNRISNAANQNGFSQISNNLLCEIADRKCREKQESQSK